MYTETVTVVHADGKEKLLFSLNNILQQPAFCNNKPVAFQRIGKLLSSLNDNLSYIIEYPYIDSHYRDCYYFYHAAKFEKLPRETIRVHIFKDDVKSKEFLFEKEDEGFRCKKDLLSDFYYGFFIVRPLHRFPLGHSFISPKAFAERQFLCALMQERVYLLGIKLEVCAFPHVAQDTETHTCAESSLWTLLHYYGAKYRSYQTLLPSEIIKNLNSASVHRLLPSKGLSVNELSSVLTKDGHSCMIYVNKTYRQMLLKIMRIYIESGIPLIVVLQNETSGHAIVAIGHENSSCEAPADGWKDMCTYDRKVVFMDDNMHPYEIVDANNPTAQYPNNKDMNISALIVPLQKHMYLEAEQAYMLVDNIFNDAVVSLSRYGKNWQTRLLLTSGRAFKNSLLHDSLIPSKTKNIILNTALPKFIWLCEIYRGNNLQKNHCDGILVIDSTGGKSLSSVIMYLLEDKSFITDGVLWIGHDPIPCFAKETYRHNLKGAWNEWKA